MALSEVWIAMEGLGHCYVSVIQGILAEQMVGIFGCQLASLNGLPREGDLECLLALPHQRPGWRDSARARIRWRPERSAPDRRVRFHCFALVATFLGMLEVGLDRGLEDDGFDSSFITTTATVSAVAFRLMIPWEMSSRNPAVDVRMVATRQFGACMLVMLATGGILLATTQFMASRRRRPTRPRR
jgi:hypothetical protein